MTDVIYKRSFYDKICRGIVGAGLLYVYTNAVVAIDDYKDNNKSKYKIMEIAGQDVLMYKANEQMIRIQKDWFDAGSNSVNRLLSAKCIDDVIKDVINN